MLLVLRTQALQNLDGLVDRGWFDNDRLEPSLQRRILLDVLAVLVHRGRADDLQLAPGQRGLDDVAGVHRAFGRTGADDRVQFVHEQDHVLRPLDLVHHGLDALLELAAILGARHHQRQVECHNAFVAQDLGYIALGNFLGQPFHDGRLADTGFPEKYGVVLGAAAQNLDHPLDLVLAADHRVQVALARQLREVAPEHAERGRLHFLLAGGGFTFFGRAFAGGEVGVEFLQNLVAAPFDVDVERFQDARRRSFAFPKQSKQNVFGADVIMIELLGFLLREREDLLHAGRVGNIADHLGLGSGANLLFHFHAHGLEIEAHFLQDVDGDPLAEFDQAKKQMFRAHVVVVEPVRFFAGQREHLLRSRREIVHFHHRPLILVRLARRRPGDAGSGPPPVARGRAGRE